MHFRLVQNNFTKDDWNNRISNYPNKTLYHTYEWLEFIEESQNAKKIVYEILIDGKNVGYLPGFIIRKGPIKIFASPFPGWTTPYIGPLLKEDVSQEQFFIGFKKLMKQEGFHHAELSNRELDIEIAKKEGYIVNEGVTYIAEIKESPEEILASYNSTTRNLARKGLRDNILIVETTTDDCFIDCYYEQLKQVFLKSQLKPTYSKERVKLLIKKLLPAGKLNLTWVKYQDVVISTLIDIIDDSWLYSFGVTSDLRYLHLRPNELARFHTMCTASSQGARHYDLMGGGSYKYKFGGQKEPAYTIIYSRFGLYKARNLAKKLVYTKNKISTKIKQRNFKQDGKNEN